MGTLIIVALVWWLATRYQAKVDAAKYEQQQTIDAVWTRLMEHTNTHDAHDKRLTQLETKNEA
jgi:hypothetical protein